jgi:uncharacterized membrane protein YoaK (UPF0700 family)
MNEELFFSAVYLLCSILFFLFGRILKDVYKKENENDPFVLMASSYLFSFALLIGFFIALHKALQDLFLD